MNRPVAIASRSNARVKQLRAALAGNSRLAGEMIGIEGPNLLAEAIRSGVSPTIVFLVEGLAEPHGLPKSCEVVWLTREVFASASSMDAPQGIAALLAPPELPLRNETSPLLLVAGGIQDPGNLGTLIRSAEAFGATGVLLMPGTVSAWNGKAMRASAGSVFRVPLVEANATRLAALRATGVRLLAAVTGDSAPHSPAAPVTQLDLTQGCAIMIGNEGVGLSAELLALADTRITIPTPGPVESLNAGVAGSLLLYEAARQRSAALADRPVQGAGRGTIV